jgi:hypothetical protein
VDVEKVLSKPGRTMQKQEGPPFPFSHFFRDVKITQLHEKGVLSFDLDVPDGTTTLTPFARYTKHGTWRGVTFTIPSKHHEL